MKTIFTWTCTGPRIPKLSLRWPAKPKELPTPDLFEGQGIAGLDCWIAQSGLHSNLEDWIVIDNPKSKLDFGFGLSIQFRHFNPNPKYQNYFIKKLKFHSGLCSNNE